MADKNKSNYLWIGIAVVAIVVIGIIFISNSNNNPQNSVTCNSPYIKVGTSCCLDQNYNSVCDSDEQNTQEETPQEETKPSEESYQTISIRSFDYDKNDKKIRTLTINHPDYYDGEWRLVVIGKDNSGQEIFNKKIDPDSSGFSHDYYCQNGCSSFYIDEEIPYLQSGTMIVKLISDKLETKAIGEYSYSTFNSKLSFNVVYDSYDNDEDEFIYKITNTGDRIIVLSSIVGVLFTDECGDETWGSKEWVARKYIDPYRGEDEIINPGETAKVRGLAWGSVYDIETFCTKFIYDNDREVKEFSFTV
jgi:hypothetical protein